MSNKYAHTHWVDLAAFVNLEPGIQSFIHSLIFRSLANHDHLTSSLKHIIKQTDI